MKKKGGAFGPRYTIPVPGKNLCKEEQEDALYFSKVIEYKPGKEHDINKEIQSIIQSTLHIRDKDPESKYVLYPNLDLSCGMGSGFPIPGLVREKYPDVAAIFVMPQAQPLTFKLQEVSYLENKIKIPIVIKYLNDIGDAYNFLNNNRPKENPVTKEHISATEKVFHGDPQIHNLVIHNDRVKFIDYSIYNPNFSTISEETKNFKETIETLVSDTGLKKSSLKKEHKQRIDIPNIIFDYKQYLYNIINPQHKPSTSYRRTRNSSPREQTPSKTQRTEATPYRPIGFRGFDTPPRPLQSVAFQGFKTPSPPPNFPESSYLSPPPKN